MEDKGTLHLLEAEYMFNAPFNLVLGVKDSKMCFPLILMVDRGLKLQLCQTLKRVLEFFTLEAAEH